MQPIKNYIRNPKALLTSIVVKCYWIFSDETYLKIRYYLCFGKRLNLKNPLSFSEKLQWLKLYNRRPEYTTMVDKYAVKDYVTSIIGEEYIIPTLGVWDRPEDIDFDSLPDQFVLKTTHGGGGGGVVICKDKANLDIPKVILTLKKSLKSNIYNKLKEWPYKKVQPRILAEKFLNFPDVDDLYDYKFFCFNGEPEYCQVISGRGKVMAIDFFDKKWQHQPFHEPKDFPFSAVEHSQPLHYELMLDISRKLAKDIPFVRIDFYNVKGNIYFGEITFFPTSGFGGFSPEEWDLKFGRLIRLPK